MSTLLAPTEQCFIRAICETPDDDAPRLIFADWLEEHNQSERAEFIRLHIALERSGEKRCKNREDKQEGTFLGYPLLVRGYDCGECWWCKVVSRALKLNDQYGAEWAPSCRGIFSWKYNATRGFVSQVEMSCQDWLTYGPELVQEAPITKVTLRDKSPAYEVDTHSPNLYPWAWYFGLEHEHQAIASFIPRSIFYCLDRTTCPAMNGLTARYAVGEIAQMALSRAALAYARNAADLPPLPTGDKS